MSTIETSGVSEEALSPTSPQTVTDLNRPPAQEDIEMARKES
jgi:hypothetical protein